MLILIFNDVQYSQNVVFNFEKALNVQMHSSSYSNHPLKKFSQQNFPSPNGGISSNYLTPFGKPCGNTLSPFYKPMGLQYLPPDLLSFLSELHIPQWLQEIFKFMAFRLAFRLLEDAFAGQKTEFIHF